VNRALAEAIVGCLSFSGQAEGDIGALKRGSEHEWEHVLSWLYDAGLALYLLQKLQDINATDVLPKPTLTRLEDNLTANRRRVAHMARQFDFLNQKFNDAGVRYAAVKGFSLVPQFCPDASLRHQGDFDYLIDNQSLPVARRVLEDAGYALDKHKTNELIFLMPSVGVPLPADEQFEAHAPHAVELRRAFWDSDFHSVLLVEPKFSVDNTRTHRWQELVFRTLPEEDAFLLQVMHAFNHILTGWIRMCWLYEIGYFLNQRSRDTLLWERIERRIGADPLLHEIVVVVTGLAAHFFKASLPPTSSRWEQELRPAIRIWIQNYAWAWVCAKNRVDQLGLFSAAKLVLLLHQQYLPDMRARRRLIRIRLLPWEQFRRRTHSITTKSSTNSGGRGQRLKRMFIRFVFHLTGGLRYLWEIPRWRRLKKATAHLALSTTGGSTAKDPVNAQSSGSTI